MSAKVDKLEMAKRIRIVQEWMLQDHITTDIINNCMKQWGISDRQAYQYLKKASEGFEQITEKKLEKRLNYHLQRRTKLLRDLDPAYKRTPEGIKAQLQVLEDIAKLEKLYTIKIEHTGKDGAEIKTKTTHEVVFADYGTPRG